MFQKYIQKLYGRSSENAPAGLQNPAVHDKGVGYEIEAGFITPSEIPYMAEMTNVKGLTRPPGRFMNRNLSPRAFPRAAV